MSADRAKRCYKKLLTILPAEFRAEAEAELVEVFCDGYEKAISGSRFGVVVYWLRTLRDLLTSAGLERWAKLTDATSRKGSIQAPRSRLRAEVAGLSLDFRIVLRRLARSPSSSALTVGTLGLGIAATVLAVTLVREVLLRPLDFPESDRLVRLVEESEDGRIWWPSYLNFVDWRREAGFFDGLIAAEVPSPKTILIQGSEGAVARVAHLSRGFVSTLGVPMARGRSFLDEENSGGGDPAAISSWNYWQGQLGGRDLQDLSIVIGSESFAIVGVLPEDFAFLADQGGWGRGDIYLPMDRLSAGSFGGRQSHGFHVVGRLAPGISLERGREEMNRVAATVIEAHRQPSHAQRVQMTLLQEAVVGRARQPIRLVLLAAIVVLVITCLNSGGVLLARGLKRSRELAVILSLGARRRDLVRHLLSEAVLLSSLGALLAILLSWGALRLLPHSEIVALPRLDQVSMDWTVVGFALSIAFISSLFAGMAPAWTLSRGFGIRRALRAGANSTNKRQGRLWNGFVAGQLALSMILFVMFGLLIQSFSGALSMDLGYQPEGVLVASVSLPESRYAEPTDRVRFYEEALARIRGIPGVRTAGMTNVLPHEIQAQIGGAREEGDEERWMFAGRRLIDSSYLDVIGIPMTRGRNPAFVGVGSSEAIVDQAILDRIWSDPNPIGDCIQLSNHGEVLTVVGTAGSVRAWDVGDGSVGTVYMDYRVDPSSILNMHLVVAYGSSFASLASDIRRTVSEVDAVVPVRTERLDHMVRASLADRSVILGLIGAFTALSLLLVVSGVYGIVAFIVTNRRREVAIRLALGAEHAATRRRSVRYGFGPAVFGLLLGAAISFPAAAVFRSFLDYLGPTSPVVVGSAAAVLVISALVAAYIPAHRGVQVDLRTVLKED